MADNLYAEMGVTHEAYLSVDRYQGTKDALVGAGICKLEWFPDVPQAHRRGIKRKFVIREDSGNQIVLWDRLKGKWLVHIAVSEEERERRGAEDNRRRELEIERERRTEEAERAARLKAIKLPPFVPSSMTVAEIHFMQMVRALDQRHRHFVSATIENCLAGDIEAFFGSRPTETGAPQPERPRHLELVVDNDQRSIEPGPFSPGPAA